MHFCALACTMVNPQPATIVYMDYTYILLPPSLTYSCLYTIFIAVATLSYVYIFQPQQAAILLIIAKPAHLFLIVLHK